MRLITINKNVTTISEVDILLRDLQKMLRQLPGNTNIDHREIDDWYQTDRDTPAYAKMTDDEIVYCLTKITTHPLHQMMKVTTKCSTLIWRQKTMLTICASQRCVCYENRWLSKSNN